MNITKLTSSDKETFLAYKDFESSRDKYIAALEDFFNTNQEGIGYDNVFHFRDEYEQQSFQLRKTLYSYWYKNAPDKVKIVITADDINNGVTDPIEYVFNSYSLEVDYKQFYTLSRRAKIFLNNFRNHKPVYPTSFILRKLELR